MNILEVSHVCKRFGGKEVLHDVSFSVPEHTVYGFVGPNGAGKTTTMKLILGLLAADSGEIMVNGKKVVFGGSKTNQYIGYLPDVPEFYSFLTPEEYLTFCGAITGMEKGECKERIRELLGLVGLAEEKRRMKGFSRGMKQRIGIAQALLNRPKLLICDEPTSALDPVGRKEILDILEQAKQDATVLFSTHILSDVERICQEVVFLHQGNVAHQGSMKELRERCGQAGFEIELERREDLKRLLEQFSGGLQEKGDCLLYGPRSGQQMEHVLAWLIKEQIGIRRAEKKGLSLESLFMEAVGK